MRSGFKLGTFLSLCITAAMASCGSDETAPTNCGNNVREGDELCDGADLAGNACNTIVSQTSSGVLRCAGNCIFDTSGCSGAGGAGGQGGAGPTP